MSREKWMREQERKKRERQRKARQRRNCAIIVILLAVVSVIVIVASMNNSKTVKTQNEQTAEFTQSPDFNRNVAQNPYITTRTVEDIKTSFFQDSAFAGGAVADTIGMYGVIGDAKFYSNVNADLDNIYTMTTAGSTTSIVEQFKSKNFKKVFLTFGENELAKGNPADFKIKYRDLIDKIREYQPNVTIYLISIPPVTAEASERNVDGVTMSRILSYNRQIKTLAVEEDLYFIDSIDALGDNKDFLPSGVSIDGINLNKPAVIDLLYYITKEAYIPTRQDLEDDDKYEEEDAVTEETTSTETTAEETQKPSATKKPDGNEVNVLKDSVIKQNEG